MRKVLAAVDNSAAARPVLAVAEEVAKLFGCTPEGVHVREDGARTVVAEAAAAAVPLREIEAANVVDGLLAAGRERDVAAVVLGARAAQTGPRPAGHVALELIIRLQKPVVVVPPLAPIPCVLERILVPLDATSITAAALARTVELACRRHIRVVVLHVYDENSIPAFTDQPQHELEAWSREFLARYCPRIDEPDLEVRVGVPGERVLEAATETGASMIALGWAQDLSPGRAGVVREAVGRSSIPVLLVPVRTETSRSRSTEALMAQRHR